MVEQGTSILGGARKPPTFRWQKMEKVRKVVDRVGGRDQKGHGHKIT